MNRLTLRFLAALLSAVAAAGTAQADEIYSWGNNDFGQLGRSSTNQFSPVQVTGAGSLSAFSAGASFALGIQTNGTPIGWGINTFTQLADGSTTQRNPPVTSTQITGLVPAVTVTQVSAGADFSLWRTSGGNVLAQGANNVGQAGNNSFTTPVTSPSFVRVSGGGNLANITAVSTLNQHSLALTTGGTVQAWGLNDKGQIGNNTQTNQSAAVTVLKSDLNPLTGVTMVSAGGQHSLAASGGNAYGWGQNDSGQVGNGTNTTTLTAVLVQTVNGPLTDVAAVAAGFNHSLALTTTGQVYSWGDNANGQLGVNSNANSSVAALVGGALTGKTVVKIAAGFNHSLALTSDGQLYAWGLNTSGQLGQGVASTNPYDPLYDVPTLVTAPNGFLFSGMDGGNDFTIASFIPVPEPATWAALGGFFAASLGRSVLRRRRTGTA